MKSPLKLTFVNSFIANLALTSLIISIFSGIIVSYHYLYSNPLLSVIKLETQVSFGKFFRNLHYLSSQLAFIFTFLHLIDSIYKNWFYYKKFVYWSSLILSFILITFLTFTGYILRFDELGRNAGMIAENFSLSIPIIGNIIRDIFFPISKGGLYRVYLFHIYGSFFLLLSLFIWHCSFKKFLNYKNNFILIYLNLILPLFIYIPLESGKGKDLITGPWFFLGVQGLLKFVNPLIVLIYIFIFFFLLIALAVNFLKRYNLILKSFIVGWLLSYIIFALLLFKK